MCKFFSFVTNGSKMYYFCWQKRQELLKNNPHGYHPDSHTSICHFHGISDDKVNKYEFNPLTKIFEVDQINIKNDQARARKWVECLDFKTIVEPLIIKPIVNPFLLTSPEITEKHVKLLKEWASVWDSVGASVWASVGASVGDSVWDSVWDSVGASVGDSVGDSVRDSVRSSVWASVEASIEVYTSSFYCIEKWKNMNHTPFETPFQSCIDLWNEGLIPSYDGKTWRLHAGKDAKIVYKLT